MIYPKWTGSENEIETELGKYLTSRIALLIVETCFGWTGKFTQCLLDWGIDSTLSPLNTH